MSKARTLIARIEEQAIALHEARQQNKDAFAAQNRANERVQALARERDDLQKRVNGLVEESREIRARLTRIENARTNAVTVQKSQTLSDAASLIDRDDLTDTEKVRSISGLLDQVLPHRKPKMPFFVKDEDKPPPAAPPKARRAPRKAVSTPNATVEEPRAATADDAPEYVTPDGMFDAEAEAEDAREFNRDY